MKSVIVTVIQSCNTEKVVKSLRTDDIIQYGNNMLILWQVLWQPLVTKTNRDTSNKSQE